ESEKATLDDKAWDLYEVGRIDKSEFIELAGHNAFRIRSQEAA
ncbi:plasmid transfer ATPase TraJ, partial [Xylella fastidiosa subsp. multiplex]|nr:plasmid transfer ATPase TraJ [Xylella fastidiosa subsp. multiplex]